MIILYRYSYISRWQDKNKTYLIPFSDFQDLLNDYVPPQHIQTLGTSPIGTQISASDFDATIQDKLTALFKKEGFSEVREKILKLAGKKSEEIGIGELLCSSDIKIERAIGWLTKAAAQAVQNIPKEEGLLEQREDFKENAKKILGWLVLRAVDPAWVETDGHRLLQEQNAQVRVRMGTPTGVEIVVARALEQASRFEGDSRKLLGRRAVTSLTTEGGIEAPETDRMLFALIWKKVVKIPPLDEQFRIDDHLKTLQDCLEARYWADTFDYLALPVDGPKAPLTLQDIEDFHQNIPFIKLVLLQCEGDQSALLVDDGTLHWQILIFFQRVIEERND